MLCKVALGSIELPVAELAGLVVAEVEPAADAPALGWPLGGDAVGEGPLGDEAVVGAAGGLPAAGAAAPLVAGAGDAPAAGGGPVGGSGVGPLSPAGIVPLTGVMAEAAFCGPKRAGVLDEGEAKTTSLETDAGGGLTLRDLASGTFKCSPANLAPS